MKITAFDRIDTLNAYLQNKRYGTLEIKTESMLVGERKGESGEKIWDILDRFFVIEK